MTVLEKNLRNILQNAIIAARTISENAAASVVASFSVGDPVPFQGMAEKNRETRNKLRAHGRQLGDKKREDGTQEVRHLVEEIAYQHWHQMLFSRFLSENNLLVHPTEKVSVSLSDCDELAEEEGYENGWDCAALYASRMLPQIFRTDSPLASLKFPLVRQQELENILQSLPSEVFHASDSLGWCYQYWQEKRKNDIKDSEVKIGADELAPVTQLFTEPYMVSFLLDNALGAWFASRRLTDRDFSTAATEDELRKKASIPGVPLDYLRFIRDERTGIWQIASSTLDDWPNNLSELKMLDPCCGSGHFLVSVFNMLVPIRMYLEGLSVNEAIQKVIRENINGLELDERCVELAAFALAFAAWTFPGSNGYQELPKMNIACCGKSINIDKASWAQLVKDNPDCQEGLNTLYEEFQNAPSLGSLLDPISRMNEMILFGSFEETKPVFQKLIRSADSDKSEAGITALGVADAAELLSQEYHWVVTNPPFLTLGKQDATSRDFSIKYYPEAKNNLSTVMLDRSLNLLSKSGICSFVIPQNWLFLGIYKLFRIKILNNKTFDFIASLGTHSFQTPMFDFNVMLIEIGNKRCSEKNYLNIIDASQCSATEMKGNILKTGKFKLINQRRQLSNSDSRITFSNSQDSELMSEISQCVVGMQTGDDPRYVFKMQEIATSSHDVWEWFQNTPERNEQLDWCEGFTDIVRWEQFNGAMKNSIAACPCKGRAAIGKRCIALIRLNIITPLIYSSSFFHQNLAVVIPSNPAYLSSLWCYCSSPEYSRNVRLIDQKLNVTNATLVKVPFDKERWEKEAQERYPNGLPLPFTDDPTQWIFHGHPCASVVWDDGIKWTKESPNRVDDTVLQVAVARLLGYKWPAELDDSLELANEQRAVVSKVKEIFSGIGDEDGIVCIPSLGKERPAADRLLDVLSLAYGSEWSNTKLNHLLDAVGFNGKRLEEWLRDGFFKQHCKLFVNRPFIWQIWDGLSDGFSVLVNYHKFGKKNLEKLIYSVLGDWIRIQESDKASGTEGAGQKLDAANALKRKLIAILEGESPLDVFVRWKTLEEQSIGWNPDLDDGVRLNIRPFLTVETVKAPGCGVLRDCPNIKWGKDRGKDVESSPWYSVFHGDRINDYHLTLSEKKKVSL